MWALRNMTRFAAERTFVRSREGAELWVVVVKGTFRVEADGSTSLAEEQEPVTRVPRYSGEAGRSSLLRESELIPGKPATDVLVLGHAYAPSGRAERVDVSIEIGPLRKRLTVFGDRTWQRGLGAPSLPRPEPFERMPITYERAFGGADPRPELGAVDARNPVGTGFALAPELLIGRRAPNVELPDAPIARWDERPRPAGFGPIPAAWSPRLELAGTHDEAWLSERHPLPPVDFDVRFHQAAPADQQVDGYLRGGEPVALRRLTPAGELRFRLPKVGLAFSTRLGRDVHEHRSRLHTVILEPDERRVILVWHTCLPCHGRDHELESTTITEKRYVDLA